MTPQLHLVNMQRAAANVADRKAPLLVAAAFDPVEDGGARNREFAASSPAFAEPRWPVQAKPRILLELPGPAF
jgi:hypothetical protein